MSRTEKIDAWYRIGWMSTLQVGVGFVLIVGTWGSVAAANWRDRLLLAVLVGAAIAVQIALLRYYRRPIGPSAPSA